jgi:DNA-binding transcriptional regulator GbsR (MarR family)
MAREQDAAFLKEERVMELTLTEAEQDLIERIGVLHDELGHSPAPGRVVGLLLVSPRPSLTFDEIRNALGLSKSSTSAALNLLMRIGSVEYETRPGERKRYFRKSYRDWEAALLQRIDKFLSLRELLREAHELHQGNPERSGQEIPRMIAFFELLEETVHEAYRRWTVEHGPSEPGALSDPSGPLANQRQGPSSNIPKRKREDQ